MEGLSDNPSAWGRLGADIFLISRDMNCLIQWQKNQILERMNLL